MGGGGGVVFGNGMIGNSATINVLPWGWGGTYRATAAFDASPFVACIIDAIAQEECGDNVSIQEQALIMTRAFDGGVTVVGVERSEVESIFGLVFYRVW